MGPRISAGSVGIVSGVDNDRLLLNPLQIIVRQPGQTLAASVNKSHNIHGRNGKRSRGGRSRDLSKPIGGKKAV
jgi:hypothetical protein